MNPELLKYAQENLDKMPPEVQQKVGELIAEARKLTTRELAHTDFMAFVNYVWPNFIHGRHHQRMARAFERVARGECKRLIINMAPRHSKSEMASYLLPAWFLGKFPQKKIIQASYNAELAVGFGRKVRNLVDSEAFKNIFPEVELRSDSKAAGRWNTNHNGDYFAIGVGGNMTGRGADIMIIDDPHSEQEATQAEFDPTIYDKTFEWYTSGPRQRLQPGGAIVIVMCMTGDTPVLMATGKEKPLKDIKLGDEVATYDNGKVSTAKVLNWQSNGLDSIYKIQTQSGIIVRANERHPFLVDDNGELIWKRLKELKPGDLLVSLKDAKDQVEPLQNEACALHVKPKPRITEKTQTHHSIQLDTTENGKIKRVLKNIAMSLSTVTDCAIHTILKTIGGLEKEEELLKEIEKPESKVGMGSLLMNTIAWSKNKTVDVLYVENYLETMLERIGAENSVSITAMIPEKLEDCYATTVISQLDMEKPQKTSSEPLSTYVITREKIFSITPDGEEEVFDVQIERTENFIANGLVSHNTRWSKKDLTGQILKAAAQRSGETWEVIELPALLPSDKPIWPEFWSVQELEALKRELPIGKWMAQYQQQPTSDVSAIIKREWWNEWEHDDPPHVDFIIQSWDTAFTKNERSDYSACTTWGVFYEPDDTGVTQANIILLDFFKARMEFPELKQKAFEMWKYWEPDSIIIEAKASGAPLVFEMRATGIPVQEFVPTRGNDKISRVNAIADIFASGRVWAPATHWAEELIEEIASFPGGEHDDGVDSMSMAMMRFRKGGFLRLPTDEEDEQQYFQRKRAYY